MIFYGILTLLIIAIDQIIKHIVANNLSYGDSATLIPQILNITYAENRGAALGMLQNKQFLFVAVGILIVLIFAYLIFVKKISNKVFLLSASLIVGGGIGNLIDRILQGYVIDYLQLSFFSPVCNFADYCITVGTALLIIYLLFFMEKDQDLSTHTQKEK